MYKVALYVFPPALKHLSLFERVALHSDVYSKVELEVLDVSDCRADFAYRAMRACKNIKDIIGYAPERTVLKKDNEPIEIVPRRDVSRVRYHYSSSGNYPGMKSLNKAFAQGTLKFDRLSKK